ncbi:hypothetical protein KTR66_04530 [Roseococcus sp. SDR]|uniref:hypothetical protein n=1 Tax=Roseococcus sp. SDR TaxID=2835532 RepID=UPI001BCF7D1A|nr:hypothetical protein [Roseococcus sp. SDR]MBS7789245.1 hypothetical protein [Roseococcus sp. SDR]MBV1844559.1 hypothetical protein [Roseococcus sp. SDR]
MLDTYAQFLASKAPRAAALGAPTDPERLAACLADFQAASTAFCLTQGRAGLFLDTGLGKTRCELEFADVALERTNGRALILTPLAVARQIEEEAQRLGYDARVIRGPEDVRPGISICNYDRLPDLDPSAFGVVVLDESSILKNFTGATSRALINAFQGHRYRLAATATPAPNDHMELGQHAEFLGVMPSNEMLMRWFVTDQTSMGKYRLKNHGESDFWDWMASWARMAQTPEDLGFDGGRYVLPQLVSHRHKTHGDVKPMKDGLFAPDISATTMHDVKRQTITARADVAGALVAAEPAEPWVLWVDTDYEADAVRAAVPGAIEVRGSMSIEAKEEALAAFAHGQALHLITKPRICGYGLNWQHCARMGFVGRSFSYEAWYQAVRRCWRFGQQRDVHAHVIVAEGEDQIGRVIDRKAQDHARMKAAMAAAMRRALGRSVQLRDYTPGHKGRLPAWLTA